MAMSLCKLLIVSLQKWLNIFLWSKWEIKKKMLLWRDSSSQNQNYIFVLLDVALLPSFGDIGRRDFCLISNIMGLNGGCYSPSKNTFEKLNNNVSFQKSLLKIIHRPCCGQFHVGTTFLLNRTTFLPAENCSVDYFE